MFLLLRCNNCIREVEICICIQPESRPQELFGDEFPKCILGLTDFPKWNFFFLCCLDSYWVDGKALLLWCCIGLYPAETSSGLNPHHRALWPAIPSLVPPSESTLSHLLQWMTPSSAAAWPLAKVATRRLQSVWLWIVNSEWLCLLLLDWSIRPIPREGENLTSSSSPDQPE